jgi:hypothetical protein
LRLNIQSSTSFREQPVSGKSSDNQPEDEHCWLRGFQMRDADAQQNNGDNKQEPEERCAHTITSLSIFLKSKGNKFSRLI